MNTNPTTDPSDTDVVYYHADCLDGFGSAFAAWSALGPATRLIPIHYGQDWQREDVCGRRVFVLDFSFPPQELLKIAAAATTVLQLDHHATARDHWTNLLSAPDTSGFQTHSAPNGKLTVRFNMQKSGARMAWEFFHPDKNVPWLVRHIEDLDLWKFKLEGTADYCRALRLRPFDPAGWQALSVQSPGNAEYELLLSEGRSVSRFVNLEVGRLAEGRNVIPCILHLNSDQQVSGLAINANALFASELGNVLAERSGTFGAIWHLSGDGEAKVSLRANGKVNVATIAEFYGGGGHPNAAGMRLPLEAFRSTLQIQPNLSRSN